MDEVKLVTRTTVSETGIEPNWRPWLLSFESDGKIVTITVKGGNGGLKARFKVKLDQLKTAVESL